MKKKPLVAVLGFLVVILFVFLIWFFNRPEPHPGLKEITLNVFHGDGTYASFNISTSSDNLRGALEQIDGLFAGEDSVYGLMVFTVDGETADWDRDQSWWCLTKGGEWLDTGVDDTLIEDGDHYEFTYTIG